MAAAERGRDGLKYAQRGRIMQMERRRELQMRGIAPTRRSLLVCVEMDGMDAPQWALDLAHPSFESSARRLWVRRPVARSLARLNRECGGAAVLTEVDCRVCPGCDRLLLDLDAELRRMRDESCRTGRMLPCDGECVARQQRMKGTTRARA